MRIRPSRDAPTVAAALIQAARRKQSLTQRELAALAGVSQQTISRIERGASDPGLRQLNGILRSVGLEARVRLGAYEDPERIRSAREPAEDRLTQQAEADARLRVM